MGIYGLSFAIGLPIQTLFAFLCIGFSAHFCYQIRYERKMQSLLPIYRRVTVVCVAAASLTVIIDLIRLYYVWLSKTFIFDLLMTQVFATSSGVTYYVSSDAFYILGLLRLHLNFRRSFLFTDSQYKIGSAVLITLLVISICANIYYVIICGLMDGPAFFYKYNLPNIYIIMANDGIFNIFLMALFVYKLKQTVIEGESSQSSSTASRSHPMSPSLSPTTQKSKALMKSSQKMISLMSKTALLFGISIITNQFYLVVLTSGSYSIGLAYFAYTFRAIECFVNVLVVYLHLNVNDTVYLCMCGVCHRWVLNCFSARAKQEIIDSYVALHDMEMSPPAIDLQTQTSTPTSDHQEEYSSVLESY